ncbi:MAG: OB-fold nucleic acid binding domain-containing protein, partial [Phycisphaerae bacterium]|nr:OB-fold nucleic acid binding domain-containing protein [Phycisphaerae bacterium]
QIFSDILEFGSYAFNKAHSTGYAIVAYKTAYLKTYFPTEYMAALLTFEMDSTEKVSEYIDECRRMSIRIAPPDVNVSENDFTVVGQVDGQHEGLIRFGLAAIKGVGEKAVAAIMEARQSGPFKSIYDFTERVDLSAVNRGVVEALIKSGSFDHTGASRKGLVAVLDDAIAHGARAAADRRSGQMSLFGGGDEGGGWGGGNSNNSKDGGNSSEQRPKTSERAIPDLRWTDAEMLAHEKATLGFYVSNHPLTSHERTLRKYGTARTTDLRKYQDGHEVVLGGIISKMRTVVTKQGRNAGSKMAIVTVEDANGSIEAVLFSKELQTYQAQLIQDAVAFFRGQVDRRREEPSLRVTEVVPIEQADERLGRMVLIRLHSASVTGTTLQELHRLIGCYPGDRPIFLELHTSNALKVTLRSNGRRGVTSSQQFQQAVRQLLGPDSIVILGPHRLESPQPAETVAAI